MLYCGLVASMSVCANDGMPQAYGRELTAVGTGSDDRRGVIR